VFTARYALSAYIKQIRFAFKGLMHIELLWRSRRFCVPTSKPWAKPYKMYTKVNVKAVDMAIFGGRGGDKAQRILDVDNIYKRSATRSCKITPVQNAPYTIHNRNFTQRTGQRIHIWPSISISLQIWNDSRSPFESVQGKVMLEVSQGLRITPSV
jgi:hypothetical protein